MVKKAKKKQVKAKPVIKEQMTPQELAENAFYIALLEAQREIQPIVRGSTGESTGFSWKYASLEEISRIVDPILRKHNFVLTYGMEDSPIDGYYRIVGRLVHARPDCLPHMRDYRVDLPADIASAQGKSKKTEVQGAGSTISYGRRYIKILICDLNLVNEDNDGAVVVTRITAAELKRLTEALADGGPDLDRFNRHFHIRTLSDLPSTSFAEAMTRIEEFKRRATAAKAAKETVS